MNIDDIQNAFRTQKLYCGRMLAASKVTPKGHVCVWNANVITESCGKVWFGDLDLTLDKSTLKMIAIEINEPLYVLREMDARFGTENNPLHELIEKAVWTTK